MEIKGLLNMKIPLISEIDASKLTCPFLTNLHIVMNCSTKECMAWTIVQRETIREDHSGGAIMMQELASRYGIRAERLGPRGSTGEWKIPNLGYCKRLWPMAPPITPAFYTAPGLSAFGSELNE